MELSAQRRLSGRIKCRERLVTSQIASESLVIYHQELLLGFMGENSRANQRKVKEALFREIRLHRQNVGQLQRQEGHRERGC